MNLTQFRIFSAHVCQCFQTSLTEEGRPTLNVGGIIPWAGVLGTLKIEIKERELSSNIHFFLTVDTM